MKVLIIGAGTVGSALGTLITKAGHDVAYQDKGDYLEQKDWDIIHFTVPMVDQASWVALVNGYTLYNFRCKYLIIESSIVPSALDGLGHPCIIYSPIRATEAIMPQQLKTLKKFWAFVNEPVLYKQQEVMEYLHSVYPQGTRRFHDARALAFGKLLEVVDFGLQIQFAQQVKLACEKHGWHFEEAYIEYRKESKYGADYTKLKQGAPQKWVPRAIFRPDVIGGKCVIQDAQLMVDADLLWDEMYALIENNTYFKEWKEAQ